MSHIEQLIAIELNQPVGPSGDHLEAMQAAARQLVERRIRVTTDTIFRWAEQCRDCASVLSAIITLANACGATAGPINEPELEAQALERARIQRAIRQRETKA